MLVVISSTLTTVLQYKEQNVLKLKLFRQNQTNLINNNNNYLRLLTFMESLDHISIKLFCNFTFIELHYNFRRILYYIYEILILRSKVKRLKIIRKIKMFRQKYLFK